MSNQIAEEIRKALQRYDDADDMVEISRADYLIQLEAIDWLRTLLEERDKHISLFERIHADVNRFSELVGVDPGESTLEEKAAAFNRTIERITKERDRKAGALDDMFQNREKWRMAHEDLSVELQQLQEELEQVKGERNAILRELEWFIREYPESSSNARSIQ